MMRKAPSLVDLCVQLAINNVRYLGDVGDIDYHLLDRILSHCSLDQLIHIENSTEGRDLSPVTDKLWKKFYKIQFGVDSMNTVVERMRQKKVTFKWKQLFEAKEKEREEATQKSLDRIKQRYQEEVARKQSRQVQLCSKVPPSSKKRSYWGGAIANNIYNTKSNLMKKAKLDFVNSREVKNIAAMKKTVVHRNPSVSANGKPIVASGFASSSSKMIKPVQSTPIVASGFASSSSKMIKPVQSTPIVASGFASSSSKMIKPIQSRGEHLVDSVSTEPNRPKLKTELMKFVQSNRTDYT